MFRSDRGGAGAELVGDGGGELACQRGGKGLHRVRNPCDVAKPALSLRDAGGDRLTAWRIAVRGGVSAGPGRGRRGRGGAKAARSRTASATATPAGSHTSRGPATTALAPRLFPRSERIRSED